MVKNTFILCQKLSSFLRYLSFCPNFCGHVGKRLYKKAKVNLEIYDVRDWIINNNNTHTPQYLKK